MGSLVYSAICSLDGVTADRSGRFDWAFPGEEVVEHLDEEMPRYSTFLYGRRMYETMAVWETDPAVADQSPASADFARHWQSADKVVYSTTLGAVSTTRTRLERSFEADGVRALKEQAAGDLAVDGPTLATTALRLGVVDEVQLVVVPVSVGGGLRVWPDDVSVRLELRGERRFGNGMVELRYHVTGSEPARRA